MKGIRDDVLETMADAERVLQGSTGELLAVKMLEPGKALVAVYRETSSTDGFIITAFLIHRLASLD